MSNRKEQFPTCHKDPPTSLKELAASLDLMLVAGGDLSPHGKRAPPQPCHEWLLPLVTLKKSNKWLFTLATRFLSCWIKTWCLIRRKDLRLLQSPFNWDFLEISDTQKVVKRFKDFCLWPITLLLKRTSLPSPWRGKFLRVQRTWLMTRVSTRKLTFCQTVLQLKRVSPPVPEDFVLDCLEKHKRLMTGEPRQSDGFVDRVRSKVRELLTEHCSRCNRGKGVCTCWSFDPCPLERVRDFSLRACLEQPWGRGNYAAWHNSIPDSDRLLSKCEFTTTNGSVHYSSAFYFPSRVEVSPSREELSRYMVRVVPICEPLKVRVITVGPRWHSPYWAKFQRSLQRYLSCFPFIFSRKELRPDHFDRFFTLLDKKEAETGEAWCIVSDDASAATDSLRSDLPRILSEYIKDDYVRKEFDETWNSWIYYPKMVDRRFRPLTIDLKLDESFWDITEFESYLEEEHPEELIALRMMGTQFDTLESSKLKFLLDTIGLSWGPSWLPLEKYGIRLGVGGLDWFVEARERGDITRQVNGQLMGDRRSFPILCLLHSAVKLLFLESLGLKEPWRYFAVNGDDGIVVIPRNQVENYFKFSNEFWELNRLKTYTSRDLISFNSQFFQRRGTAAKQVPIIRWNLLINNNKNGSPGGDPRVWNVVRECAPSSLEGPLFREFLRNWKSILDRCSKLGCNWFLPLSVGGAGLKTSKPFKITGRQYFAIAETRRRIGEDKDLPFKTRVRPVQSTTLNKGTEYLLLNGVKRLAKKSPDDLEIARPGAIKACHENMRMFFRRLPNRYSGKVPWFDLSDLALRVRPKAVCTIES